ncbi:hypothetical protein evm_015352 [Chilo suppressalis]|nr:hypothetical protein evm_015352 [Chilo suppressalis]
MLARYKATSWARITCLVICVAKNYVRKLLISTVKMPRNYVRKTDNASYPLEKLLEAVKAVKSGRLSGYEASKHYGIPRSTIINRVYDRKGLKSSTLGRATVLSREVEEDFVKKLRVMEKYGFGLTRKELLETVGQYVSVNLVKNPFKNGVPGEDWFLSFKKRHELSIKKPQPVEYARKLAISPFVIYPYFDLLEETVNELGLSDKPSHIWNVDETSFSKDPSKSKVVGCKGFTSTRTIASPGKDNTTILLGCNALGEKTPPMIVLKGKNVWDQWTSPEDYPGTAYAATSNGWMETPVFDAYFEKVFLKTVGEKRPILLLYDGHATHVGINLIKMAREANITILKIPPHTSHVLQPLDLAVNKSFKDRWDAAILKWQRMNIGKILPKKEFSKMIGQIWKTLDPAICAAGFRKGGIYPLNKLAVPENQFHQDILREWKQKSSSNATSSSSSTNNQITANTESQEPGTFTQADPVFEDKSPKNNTFEPDSLLKLSLKIIMHFELKQIDDCRSSHVPKCTQNSFELDTESVRSSTKNSSEPSSKIQILENRLVTFEDLLLMRIKAGTSTKVKRKRVANGAEVITSEDVYKRTQETEKEKQEKQNKTKQNEERPKKKIKVKKEDIKDSREHEKIGEKAKKPLKRSKKRPNYSSTSSESETEIKYDEDSDGNEYWEELLNRSREEDEEKKDKMKRQQQRPNNRNKEKVEETKDSRRQSNKEQKERMSVKQCSKIPKIPTTLSESETDIKYVEDNCSNDYCDNTLNESHDEDEINLNKENCNYNALYFEGDWLLVKFCTKKSIKHYVGTLLSN